MDKNQLFQFFDWLSLGLSASSVALFCTSISGDTTYQYYKLASAMLISCIPLLLMSVIFSKLFRHPDFKSNKTISIYFCLYLSGVVMFSVGLSLIVLSIGVDVLAGFFATSIVAVLLLKYSIHCEDNS